MLWVITAVAFVAVFMLAMAVQSFASNKGDTPAGSAGRRLKSLTPAASAKEEQVRALMRDQSLSTIPLLDRTLGKFSRMGNFHLLITQSGVKINLGTLILMCGALSAVGLLTGAIMGSWVLATGLAVLGLYLPIAWLKIMKKRRLNAFESQFPEAIELMARALRAGHSFSSAMSMISEELDDPVAGEFTHVFDDYSFGKPLGDALDSMVARVGTQDVKFFATAVALQRETGGNLTEILDNMGYIIRERFKLMRQVKALSAEGRLSAGVLTAMPPVLLLFLATTSPKYVDLLFTHPTGHLMLIIGGVCQILGILVIRAIVTIKV